jgi:uncharacterized protein (UPF0548 family)
MLSLRPPSRAFLESLREQQRHAAFTYANVGATRTGAVITGFKTDTYSVHVGRGQAVFQAAKRMLEGWQIHQARGLQLCTDGHNLETQQTVVLVARVLFVNVMCACRVTYIINEARAFGFAYGTLPAHPECGEERFLVEWLENDEVRFSLFSFSKPSSLLFWLAYPVGRLLQRVYSHRYLQAMQKGVVA